MKTKLKKFALLALFLSSMVAISCAKKEEAAVLEVPVAKMEFQVTEDALKVNSQSLDLIYEIAVTWEEPDSAPDQYKLTITAEGMEDIELKTRDSKMTITLSDIVEAVKKASGKDTLSPKDLPETLSATLSACDSEDKCEDGDPVEINLSLVASSKAEMVEPAVKTNGLVTVKYKQLPVYAKYRVFRKENTESSATDTPFRVVDPPSFFEIITVTDDSVTPDPSDTITYHYAVQFCDAQDVCGELSESSSIVENAEPAAGTITQSSFGDFTATATKHSGGSNIVLSWTAVTGALSYKITKGEVYDVINTVLRAGVTGTTYTDSNLADNKTYFYKLSACTTSTSCIEKTDFVQASTYSGVSVPNITNKLCMYKGENYTGESFCSDTSDGWLHQTADGLKFNDQIKSYVINPSVKNNGHFVQFYEDHHATSGGAIAISSRVNESNPQANFPSGGRGASSWRFVDAGGTQID